MGFRAVVVTGLAGAFALILLGCQATTDSEECSPRECQHESPRRMEIALSAQSALITAIEVFRPWPFDGGTSGGCGVGWSESGIPVANPPDAEPVCLYPPPDAGSMSEACAARSPCPPGGNRLDGGAGCGFAWIYLLANHSPSAACSVTVISSTGERQSFGVTGYWASSSYRCHTGIPGQCVSITPFNISPTRVTLTFEQPGDGSPTDNGGAKLDGEGPVDAPDRVPDVADREDLQSWPP